MRKIIMNENPSKNLPTQCKYIYFLTMLYITLMLLTSIIGFKIIIMPYGEMSAASLFSPFWFLLGDIIAEVYGYKISMRLFFCAITCELIFAALSCIAIHLPSPADWQNQGAYNLIIGSLPKIYLWQTVGVFISWIFNAFILTRWKFTLRGKHFWFRSLITSGLAETLFSVISVSLTVLGSVKNENISSIVLWSFSLKLLFTAIFSYPINLIANWLKKSENIDVYDNIPNMNPFRVKKNENQVTR